MENVYVDSKKDEEEKIEETEEFEETTANTEEAEETTVEEETVEEETEKEEFDYKVYGKETVEETRNIAEKMFNDVVSTLKSRQAEWNKTLEEYKANKPAVDLLEYEDNLVIKVDAPRVSKEDVSVKMSTETIEIEIDFPEYISEDEEVKVLRKERCSGKTKNIIPLPVEVDLKEVKASFENNELTITLPKIRGKKVDVEIL
ncbi:MAG: Hsp20/alpha crystallin family protein [Methanosphaera stadtmanae]|nr:Hsp20/alpha crystallin family protein [Methanosphaera stadtmanae]